MIVWNRENKKQAAAAAVMVIAGIITGNLAGNYVPADSPLPEKEPAVQAANRPEETEEPVSEAETKEARKDANAYEPSITLLNLAYYFPEGADPSDVTQSYAGKVYQSLSIKDSDWLILSRQKWQPGLESLFPQPSELIIPMMKPMIQTIRRPGPLTPGKR